MKLDIAGKTIQNIILQQNEFNWCVKASVVLEDEVVTITVNDDTDELNIATTSAKNSPTLTEPPELPVELAAFIGKQIVSYWACVNHQGYFDVFMLGIDDFQPSVVFCSIASQLSVRL